MRYGWILALALVLGSPPQTGAAAPQPLPLPPGITAAEDRPYPGTIILDVDATDITRGIYRVKQTIPVAGAGPMTLLYPKWLPGQHSPVGPVDKLTGLTIRGNGALITWTRDPVDVYAFHITVPEAVTSLDLEFQFLTPISSAQGRRVVTPTMLNLQWNTVALYPAGYFTRGITYEPRVKLPEGWKIGTALRPQRTEQRTDGNTTVFKTVDFETLVDSPIFAGQHFKTFDLAPGAKTSVTLNVVADLPEFLQATPEQIELHRAMVSQTLKIFRTQPYAHYDFLLALSSEMSGIGLEHLQSSENSVAPSYFTQWTWHAPGRDLLPHEFSHAWNGKFRRGHDLWTPTFNEPMRDSLLWVYEGQTQYWGAIIAARSGLQSTEQALDSLALVAANYENQAGRTWRPLIDTTNDPIIARRNSAPWSSWQRREDYYNEGLLIWLDVDTLIRERSKGRRSLDSFAGEFFGIKAEANKIIPYSFDDIVAALNKVEPYDWASFLKDRVEAISKPPLDGLTRGGYRLTYSEEPTRYHANMQVLRKYTDLRFSLGITINSQNTINTVLWDSPAFNAGLTSGIKLVAVNGMAYKAAILERALSEAKATKKPIDLIIQAGNRFRTISIPYYDGLRYPRLERIKGTEARLDAILAPRK